jgi:uncharacterized membrane protein YhaH (DUF805 family)
MLDFYLHTLKNAFNFSGRARRKEYLIFLIGNFILGCLIGLMGIFVFDLNAQQIDKIATTAQLLLFFPGLALGIRRLHDVGKSGWFLLIGLIPIVGILYVLYLYCIKKGDVGDNQYGPDPKHED